MKRQEMLAELPLSLACAELGVFVGDFSRDILRIMRPRRLYLVDTFAGHATSTDQDGKDARTFYMPMVETMLRTQFRNTVVQVERADSVNWIESVPAGWLDFVYIDTTHSYEQTASELAASRRAVRRGGYIAGRGYSKQFPGVIRAVNETGLPFTLSDDGLPSFLIKLPE